MANFSNQQMRERRIGGGGLTLDVSLAKIEAPVFGPQCIQSNNATGSVNISQGVQFIAHNTMNGYITKLFPAGNMQGPEIGKRVAQMYEIGQHFKDATNMYGKAAVTLGTTPNYRLAARKKDEKDSKLWVDEYKTLIKELNVQRFSAYDTQGRYTIDDYLLSKYESTRLVEDAQTDDGRLLTFSLTDLYHNSLRTKFNPVSPVEWKDTVADFKSNVASEIHKMNLVAHQESGKSAGGYVNRNGTENFDVSKDIDTVMTRIYFDDFPPEQGNFSEVQEQAYEKFKDGLRFRSFEIAKHMVEDTRLWRLANPHHTMYKDKGSAYATPTPINPSPTPDYNVEPFKSYKALLMSSRVREKAIADNEAIPGEIYEQNTDGVINVATVPQSVAYWDSATGDITWEIKNTLVNTGFLNVGPDLEPIAKLGYNDIKTQVKVNVASLLRGFYPFTPLGLMESGKQSGNSFEKRTIESTNGVMWRPLIFEWEPTIHVEGVNPTIVNIYESRKLSEKFITSVFDRARYYAVVFVMVDDDHVHHYYAEATHDYREVEGLIKSFHEELRRGDFDKLKGSRVGFANPRTGKDLANDGHKMNTFLRKRRPYSDMVPSGPSIPGMLAPTFPIFSNNGGSLILVPELIDTDAGHAKQIYYDIVRAGSDKHDPQFAKQFGFLANDSKMWIDIYNTKRAAADGNTMFSRMADLPELDENNQQYQDPFPHGLRGLHSHHTQLSNGVARREQRVAINTMLYKPLVHPAIIAELTQMVNEVSGNSGPNSLQALTAQQMSRLTGGTFDEKHKKVMRRYMDIAFPKEKSWGMVQTAVNILNNALSERMLAGNDRPLGSNSAKNLFEQVMGYRFLAQTMLNNMPHLGDMQKDEVYFVVEHDLFGKLYEAAMFRKDPRAQSALEAGVGAWRKYVSGVMNTDAQRLANTWSLHKDMMGAPNSKWQKDNFLLDSSNSTTDGIKLFVFKYDDDPNPQTPYAAPTIANVNVSIGNTGLKVFPFESNDILVMDTNAAFVEISLPDDDQNNSQTDYKFDEKNYIKFDALFRAGKGNDWIAAAVASLGAFGVADEPTVRGYLEGVLMKNAVVAAEVIAAASIANATSTAGLMYKNYENNLKDISDSLDTIHVAAKLIGANNAKGKIDAIIQAATAQKGNKTAAGGGVGASQNQSPPIGLPTYKQMVDYFDSRDFKDYFRQDGDKKTLQIVATRTGGTAGPPKTYVNVFDDVAGVKGQTKAQLKTLQDHHVSFHTAGSIKGGGGEQLSSLTTYAGANKKSAPISLIGESRTLICSTTSRHIKVEDVVKAMRMWDAQGEVSTRYDNLCKPSNNPNQGIGIIWFDTNRTAASQPSLTTDLRGVVTTPSLEPLIRQDGVISFKFPQGCLVPHVQSFSVHMAYWNRKLNSNTTMERIYGDHAMRVTVDDDYDQEQRKYFADLFNEDLQISSAEMRRAQQEVHLTGGDAVRQSQYKNSTYDADNKIIGALPPKVVVKPHQRSRESKEDKMSRYTSRFGTMYKRESGK